MHIPDGVLDLPIVIILFVVSGLYGIFAFNKASKKLDDRMIPRVAVFTAMVFAFQMLNFPIAAGTSGHLLGYVLLAILLTPEIGFIGIMLVLVIQALVFADGGLLALGTNIFNMAIVALPGYYIYKLLKHFLERKGKKNLFIPAFVGAWSSVVLASIAAGIEIGISTAYPFGVEYTVPAMLLWHVLIGIGEGFITAGIVVYVNKVHPEILTNSAGSNKNENKELENNKEVTVDAGK
ncbi:MAG: energy-coupling factor ABC transporter permease [Promethearchaeota archaeon]